MSPYLRLIRFDKPTGIWLLFWPCSWAITIASPIGLPDIYIITLFFIGAIVMRSAGCVINDIVDKDIDGKVERTKNRPLITGEVQLHEAWTVFVFLLLFGLVILLQMNIETIIIGVVSIIPVALYPFMKRFFLWPQMFLAMVFNWGALMGATQMEEGFSYSTWILYIACMCWTLGYDTIYAHQDKKDDKKIGVKSTAISFADNTKVLVGFFYVLMVSLFLLIGYLNKFSSIFYVGMAFVAAHLLWQLKFVDLDSPESCMNKFKSNTILGFIVFFTLTLEKGMQF